MSDPLFMERAMELALMGKGKVSPNPLVGCVIVKAGKIIGEGYHVQYGRPHAEVNAVEAVGSQALLKGATVYVTLEPCSHFGKTPPCADFLVRTGVNKVIISNVDPNPLVSGRGIEILKHSGIEVEIGLLQRKGEELNRRFFTFWIKKRPYIILKWAQTTDGFMARENFDSKWISNPYSRQLVHKWRSEEDAIMVGTNTAKYDNPQLTVRNWTGRDPVRVVIDKKQSLGQELHLFNGAVKTLCFTERPGENNVNLEYIQQEVVSNESIMRELCVRRIHSVIVEGGSKLLHSFIEQNLWDEARVFIGEKQFGAGIRAPKIDSQPTTEPKILNDRLLIYKN